MPLQRMRLAAKALATFYLKATGLEKEPESPLTLEAAQRIAGHADSRTTKLYDRRGQKVLLEDIERVRY
jgi:hypothetical protein